MNGFIEIDNELDHCHTDGIVCPHCGYNEEDDLFEYPDADEKICNHCEKSFSFERDIQVTYSTQKIEDDKTKKF
jgi:hypothetical protein